MKRYILCFFLILVYGANVFGAAGDVSRVISGKSTEKSDVERTTEINRASRRVIGGGTNKSENKSVASRNVSKGNNESKDVASRSVSQNTNVIGRAKNSTRSVAESKDVISRSSRLDSTNNNVRRTNVTTRARKPNIDEQDNMRVVQGRAVTFVSKKQATPTAESISAAKDVLERTADLNNTCQQQYNECMDQFCAVVDANQKRCSCSDNLAKYAKVQKAVEDANVELNDVAQNIRYLGLSADEIRAIMNATEAELELSKTKDTSQTRSMLDDIADMIKDPTSSTSMSYSSGGDSLLDMDLDFSSGSSDIFGLDLFTSSNDISSKRGKELYKEATKRCKTVLNQCKDAGATESQITGNYDLAISKDCLAYEQGLENLNQKLISNVRSANLMLQKGRLSVLQNKNQYDARGCIGALENCMLDDMVCGEDYLKCLDPKKKYIDENGNVVLGQDITQITKSMEYYDNTSINNEFIKNAMTDITCENGNGACVVNYLMNKIGTGQSVKDGGLCRPVLDKCQDFTYTTNGKTSTYKPYNDVVVNYIQRAMVNIRAAQSKVISEYASTCLSDISDCYNQQITQINSLSTTVNANSIYNVMRGACYNVALTCGYAVFAYDDEIQGIPDEAEKKATLIQQISDLFYQSLLCPSNSTFDSTNTDNNSVAPNRTIGGYVNSRCKCNDGYTVWGGACLPMCADDKYRDTLGVCVSCADGSVAVGGTENQIENSGCSQCPDNASYDETSNNMSPNGTDDGYISTHCQCNSGYASWNGNCVVSCESGQYRDDNGNCASCNDADSDNPPEECTE